MGALFVGMAAVVFADVVHRVASRSPGRLAVILSGLFPGTSPEALDELAAPAISLLVLFFLCYGAVRTRTQKPGERPMTPGRALVLGLAFTVGIALVVQGFVWLKPEGIMWAPALGLALLLWVGLLGASMATYAGRHLALEMGEKLWPEAVRPKIRALAQGVAAAFCILLVVLGAMSTYDHYAAWRTSPQADLLPSVNLPKWIVFVVVPYAFGMMALRFLGRMTGLLPPPPEAPPDGMAEPAEPEAAR